MVDLGQIGYGLPPEQRIQEQGAFLAKRLLPWILEAVQSARAGKVTYDPAAMDVAFATIDHLAPLIDAEDSGFEEGEKLLLHGVFSWIVRSKQAGMLSDKRLKIAVAIADAFVELYGQAADLMKLEVDRSGDAG